MDMIILCVFISEPANALHHIKGVYYKFSQIEGQP